LLLSGWGALLKRLAAQGELAFGTPDERSVTFVAPRRWVGEWVDADPEEAVPELLRRYLDAYGPANLDELAGWSAFERPVLRRADRGHLERGDRPRPGRGADHAVRAAPPGRAEGGRGGGRPLGRLRRREPCADLGLSPPPARPRPPPGCAATRPPGLGPGQQK